MKGRVRRRHTAVDRRLQQHLFDFFARYAVVERAAQMQTQLIGTIERDQYRYRHEAPRASRQSGTAPDLSPGMARDELLELLVEGRTPAQRFLDVRLAQHRAAYLHALRIAFLLVHRFPL